MAQSPRACHPTFASAGCTHGRSVPAVCLPASAAACRAMRATHHSIEGPTGTFDYVRPRCATLRYAALCRACCWRL